MDLIGKVTDSFIVSGLLPLAVICAIIFLIMVVGEFIRIKQGRTTELQRKFVHMVVGSFIATWPWLIDRWQIVVMSLAFVLIVLIAQRLKLFQSIFGVERHTWGEVLFGLVVGILALIADQPLIFAVAMLHMSIADALAALVGIKFGKPTQYKVFGNLKSAAGTLTFFIVSVSLLSLYSIHGGADLAPIHILQISALVSLLENVGVRGFDNILVPVAIALLL